MPFSRRVGHNHRLKEDSSAAAAAFRSQRLVTLEKRGSSVGN
jgi:hypothetical protein